MITVRKGFRPISGVVIEADFPTLKEAWGFCLSMELVSDVALVAPNTNTVVTRDRGWELFSLMTENELV